MDYSNLNVTFGFSVFKLTATRFVENQFAFKKAQKSCLFFKMKFYHFSVGHMRCVGRKRCGAH